MAKPLELARPMMRSGAGLNPNQTRRQLLEERQDIATLQLTADQHLAFRVDAVHLKNRLGDVETNCGDYASPPRLQRRCCCRARQFPVMAIRSWAASPDRESPRGMRFGVNVDVPFAAGENGDDADCASTQSGSSKGRAPHAFSMKMAAPATAKAAAQAREIERHAGPR
jgi:hypothetical protein